MFIQGVQVKSKLPTHLNCIGRNMTAPPSVIAQQYSSATFVSLRFHSRMEKLGARLRHVTSGILSLLFKKLRFSRVVSVIFTVFAVTILTI